MPIIFQTCFTVIILCKVLTLGLKCTDEKCVQNNDKQLLNIEGYIIGGNRTTIDQIPHAVYIEIDHKYICGASVLTQWILLTAAHCFMGYINGEFIIDAYAGHENLHKVTILRHVTRFKSHRRFDARKFEFDLAIMFLDKALPIGETPKVKRIIIRDVYPYKVKTAQVAGWGVTNDVGKPKPSFILKSTNQKILTADKCHPSNPITGRVIKSTGLICATESLKNRPAHGDSGSGLITADYQQIGIVSFGGLSSMPDVEFYTNVTYYYSWITSEAVLNCKTHDTFDNSSSSPSLSESDVTSSSEKDESSYSD